MKIVFFTSGLSGGGAERVCCNLANFLCQREHDIEFITISDDEATYPLSTKISRQALLHQQERSNFLHDNLLRFYRVCKLIRKTRCDCYIVMLPIPTILLLSLRFLTKAKIIASERVDPSTYPPSKQKRLKKVAHKADGWVFQTEIQKNWYGNSIGSGKNHSECDQQGVHHRRILRSEKQADRFLRQADRTEKSCSPDKSIRGYNSQISSLQTGHLRRRSAAERPRIIGLKLGNCRQSQLSRLHDRNPEENRTFFTVRAFIRLRRYAQRTDGSDGFRSTLHIDRLQRWGREISDKKRDKWIANPHWRRGSITDRNGENTIRPIFRRQS